MRTRTIVMITGTTTTRPRTRMRPLNLVSRPRWSQELNIPACHPTQVNAPALTQPDRMVLDLPTPEGWKADLILAAGYITRWFLPARRQSVTHPSTNSPGRRVT